MSQVARRRAVARTASVPAGAEGPFRAGYPPMNLSNRAISWLRGASLATAAVAAVAALPAQATRPVTGRVTSEETGAPWAGVTLGATRLTVAEAVGPEAPIPVEWTAVTSGLGDYRFDLDQSLPGMNRLLVFTFHHLAFNELYGGIDASGIAPRRADAARPGVLTVDLAAGPASGVNFRIASNQRTERVPMRDGVTTLGADVWLPSRRPGLRWPALLQRTPYARKEPPRSFLLADYAVVVQSTRGREDSDGKDEVFDDDGWGANQDGYDTVEWLAARPYCDGQVGTFGASASSMTQLLLAGAAPPHLVCSIAEGASAERYHHMTYPGGVFLKSFLETWLGNQGSAGKLAEYWSHPDEDAYWDERSLLRRADEVRTPVLHIGGWYDPFSQGTLDQFRVLNAAGGPGARRNQKLVIGPWTHGNHQNQAQGALTFPAHSVFADYTALRLRWFDFWLKGKDTGVMDEPAARVYAMGPGLPEGAVAPGNVWRGRADWPPPATPTAFYLQPGGALSRQPPTAAGGSESVYLSNPAQPVPTRGGSNLYAETLVGPHDQRVVDNRADVVSWETAPLTEPLEASGPITMVLFAASDRLDTDWVVKLEDVYPDGRAMLVTDLILNARHRLGHREQRLLTPGKVERFEVRLWDSSIVFPAGHRIRVAIQSSNFPRFEVDPQTGEPFRQHTHTEIAANRVQHSAAWPSHLLLPVVGATRDAACRPAAPVSGFAVERLGGGTIRLSWNPSSDPCHRRYRIYAGLSRPEWPWIVRRPIAETGDTTLVTDVAGLFWQVVSEGTDGGNGPR